MLPSIYFIVSCVFISPIITQNAIGLPQTREFPLLPNLYNGYRGPLFDNSNRPFGGLLGNNRNNVFDNNNNNNNNNIIRNILKRGRDTTSNNNSNNNNEHSYYQTSHPQISDTVHSSPPSSYISPSSSSSFQSHLPPPPPPVLSRHLMIESGAEEMGRRERGENMGHDGVLGHQTYGMRRSLGIDEGGEVEEGRESDYSFIKRNVRKQADGLYEQQTVQRNLDGTEIVRSVTKSVLVNGGEPVAQEVTYFQRKLPPTSPSGGNRGGGETTRDDRAGNNAMENDIKMSYNNINNNNNNINNNINDINNDDYDDGPGDEEEMLRLRGDDLAEYISKSRLDDNNNNNNNNRNNVGESGSQFIHNSNTNSNNEEQKLIIMPKNEESLDVDAEIIVEGSSMVDDNNIITNHLNNDININKNINEKDEHQSSLLQTSANDAENYGLAHRTGEGEEGEGYDEEKKKHIGERRRLQLLPSLFNAFNPTNSQFGGRYPTGNNRRGYDSRFGEAMPSNRNYYRNGSPGYRGGFGGNVCCYQCQQGDVSCLTYCQRIC